MTSDTRIFVETMRQRGKWPPRRKLAWLALCTALLAWTGLIVLGQA